MSIERIMKLIRWNIIGGKRNLRRSFIQLTIAYCVIIAANNIGTWVEHYAVYSNMQTSARVALVGTGFAMLLWASLVCFNMTTKTTFINYAMLPATRAEKYVANVLYQTIGRIVLCLAAVVAADVLQAVVSFATAGAANSFCVCVGDSLVSWFRMDEIFGAITMMLFVHSTFVLGGTLFRRHQFLYTCLTWVAVPFVLSLLASGAMVAVAYFLDINEYDISIEPWWSLETYKVLAMIALYVIICMDYWLSYRLFRRIEIINNRFFN